ncbi:GntR family transcriptional regulator [Caballeronia arationis]|jgi:DNA-binding transcriptional MocR family regulator|uniref:Transcriptional regulator, GntR family n=1 Tax=Caballeronia arationis TaxID=1777142 RepID=A0A7Z7I1L5_9BURK|nr:PLP-dependent aminotransferase family protein [Caballeronia arationis]SAL05829.1 GntR family transcriptional regulator [Caballeronia arationis]SOE52708.1 transcriptional regulator, GntR family [Caballeronia arationis]
MNRFETIAKNLAEQIRAGHIPVGTTLPSLRQIIAQYGVSQSTVLRAYYLLEKWGLVRAEERAGYFVAPGAAVDEIALTEETEAPKKVDISDLVFSVLESTRHPDIVPLGSAFPSPALFPSARLLKSLVAGTRSLTPLSTVEDLPGSDHLRQQIRRRYVGTGFAVAPEEIIVTNGALEALNLCLMAVTRPGDVVAVESPGFYAALQAIERLDLRAVEIPVDPVSGLDLDALQSALKQHPIRACWFMPNFQNPTGTSLSIEKKRALVEMLREKQIPLIEDDVYQELHFSRDRPLPAKAFDSEGLVMHCSSFSKTLAPGYRIGWATAGRFADKVRRLKLMTTLSACIPAQAGIADYLEHGGYDKHLRSLRLSLQIQLEQMEIALRKWLPSSVKWVRPDGGYILWLQLPQSVKAMELHALASARGISIAPGPMFSARHAFQNCVRLNFGHPWDARFESAIGSLAEILDDPSVHH